MSSTISQTELQAVPKEESAELLQVKDDELRRRHTQQKPRPPLMRSSSVEKIIKFNAYICSQNYYFLPSLLIWLKTSQTALSNQVEKSIALFKSACFATAIYKLVDERVLSVFPAAAARWLRAYGTCLACLRTTPTLCLALVRWVRNHASSLAIYASIGLILLQLLTCLTILFSVFVPIGFVFMLVCMYVMGHVAALAMFHHMRQEEKSLAHDSCHMKPGASGSAGGAAPPCGGTPRLSRQRSRPTPRHGLGDRTISNVAFF